MHTTLAQDRVFVTVDLIILSVRAGRLQLLLARRPDPPYAGCWALPGHFVALDESAERTAEGLVEEMLNTRAVFLEQLYTFTDVGRDPRGRVISIAYLALLPWPQLEQSLRSNGIAACFDAFLTDGGLRLIGPDGAALNKRDLAFDHGRIVETGLQRLRGKIDYTEIAFHLVGNSQSFSLGELQTVFEAVLQKSIDTSNFRRTILNRYEETGRIEQTRLEERRGRGRPATLYRYLG